MSLSELCSYQRKKKYYLYFFHMHRINNFASVKCSLKQL